MSYKYTFYVGTEWNRDGEYMPANYSAPKLQLLRAEIVDAFGGYTETYAQGGFRNAAGAVVEEACAVFTVIDTTEEAKVGQVRHVAEYAKDLLKQESVLFTIERIESAHFI